MLKRILFAVGIIIAFPAMAEEQATMVITGVGEVAAVPDMATLTLGVVTQNETAAVALRENSADLAEVFEVLRAAGIAETDMQTVRFDVQPIWRNRSYDSTDPAEIVSYSVTNEIAVRIREIAALRAILDAVATAGANEFRGIAFGLQDPDPAMEAARRAAVTDAQARANVYADAAGFDILGILNFTESGGAAPRLGVMMMEAARSVPVAQGEMTVSVSVTITYEIAD